MNFFESDNQSALQAKEDAQWIAFAPIVFQTTKVLRDSGVLQFIESAEEGVTMESVTANIGMPAHSIRVLMEAALGIGLLTCKDRIFRTTKTASFILHDDLTRVNMDFTNDVCYQGMFHLEKSIRDEKPEGLKVFGDWPTIYDALADLPVKVQKSWFGFDHFYSDTAFPAVLPELFRAKPKRLLDIGGNTGKWALQCVEYDPDVSVTIMDLPGQVAMARALVAAKGFESRIHFHGCNILEKDARFPEGFDVIWMSQFLDCFSEEQIINILTHCRKALAPGGAVFILEPFWDRQRFEVSAFVLQQTSLYFRAMANGISQMYRSDDFIRCIEAAGFSVTHQTDQIGVSHTLLTCTIK